MLTNLDDLDIAAETPAEEAPPILKFRRPTQDAAPPAPRRLYLKVRRLLDFTIALGLTLIALPIVALAAVAVKLSSRGPAFYTQTRIGRGGRQFTIYKIRTMIHKCESLTGPRWTIPGDPRVTPVGWLLRRTHIDELPQLLNVLKGQMSLIGPRPERPEFVRELAQAIPDYEKRHAVLPGITGLAQVQLAPDTDFASVRRKLVYDLHHIEHMSFWLDARIMLATALHMLGMSFRRLRRLRVVPALDPSVPASMTVPEKRPQKLAA
jgi:lipopolysaccharide/colanic/teichoic acid biosynthesis glycosyltransferase